MPTGFQTQTGGTANSGKSTRGKVTTTAGPWSREGLLVGAGGLRWGAHGREETTFSVCALKNESLKLHVCIAFLKIKRSLGFLLFHPVSMLSLT